MGRSLGSGMRGFKESITGEGEQPEQMTVEAPVAAPAHREAR
jgi:Sec-independent protein translocase protein TatA